MYRPNTIREQMLWAIGAVILVVILLLVGVTLYVSQHQLYALGERNARDQVESVAARAGFAVIVGADNPTVARQLADETIGRDGVLAAELLGVTGHPLTALESTAHSLGRCDFGSRLEEPLTQTASIRLGNVWCVSAPIFQRSSTGTCTTSRCVLGRLRIVASTHSVDTIVRRLVTAILFMGLMLLAAAVVSLWRVSDRISSPLRDIAGVMRRFSTGERGARAIQRGPDEARTISRIYNELIEQQEKQARTLEETVERRTQELRAATLAAQDAERYKSTFMAHISHDMRTPLHVIQAQASEIMQEMEFWSDAARSRAHLNVIVRESAELALRVTQVLELVRGELAQDDLHIETVALGLLREPLLEKAQSLAKANGNKLILDISEGVVTTDVDKLLQIISNLIDNACKYTTGGSVDVRLLRNETGLHITVADTGIGIASYALPHVWREFRQVPSVDGRRVGGFGLGLAIVRRYTTLLGGSCNISSTVGRGTTVSVALPAVTPAAAHGVSAANKDR